MNGVTNITRLVFCLAILFSALATPTGVLAAGDCSKVDFFIYNAAYEPVFVDITNWSNATRWLGILDFNESAHFSLAPGSFEFWANSENGNWDLSGGDVYAGCTAVAISIKAVHGPEFIVHVKQQ